VLVSAAGLDAVFEAARFRHETVNMTLEENALATSTDWRTNSYRPDSHKSRELL
jgi:hypothetical protein